MAVRISPTTITSSLDGVTDNAAVRDDGNWNLTSAVLGERWVVSHTQAITALVLAEHLHLWGQDHHCAHSDHWRALLADITTAGSPATNRRSACR